MFQPPTTTFIKHRLALICVCRVCLGIYQAQAGDLSAGTRGECGGGAGRGGGEAAEGRVVEVYRRAQQATRAAPAPRVTSAAVINGQVM